MPTSSSAEPVFWLPVLEQPSNSCSPLIAPLLPPAPERAEHLRSVLLDLRHRLHLPVEELLPALDLAVEALSSVDQETALSAAADELLTSTMVVPLLKRAAKSTDAEVAGRVMDVVGTLTSSLSGHGEHTLTIGLGERTPALKLRIEPNGLVTGTRLWPCARLAVGACACGWAGLKVEGASVLELGCGSGVVGLACAALGASSVWLTDCDDAALALARRNAELNGCADRTRLGQLDMMLDAGVDSGVDSGLGPADGAAGGVRPAGMPSAFDIVVAADVLYDWRGSWAEALAAMERYLDASPHARVLCCFGRDRKRCEAARRSVEELERAALKGEAGLRCVAREEVAESAQQQGLLMLLLARTCDEKRG